MWFKDLKVPGGGTTAAGERADAEQKRTPCLCYASCCGTLADASKAMPSKAAAFAGSWRGFCCYSSVKHNFADCSFIALELVSFLIFCGRRSPSSPCYCRRLLLPRAVAALSHGAAVSTDMQRWVRLPGVEVEDTPAHEAPNVFEWKGFFWLIVDPLSEQGDAYVQACSMNMCMEWTTGFFLAHHRDPLS